MKDPLASADYVRVRTPISSPGQHNDGDTTPTHVDEGLNAVSDDVVRVSDAIETPWDLVALSPSHYSDWHPLDIPEEAMDHEDCGSLKVLTLRIRQKQISGLRISSDLDDRGSSSLMHVHLTFGG